MNIITQGYGQGGIITQGYGSFWTRVKKKIEEGLSRLIPKNRRKFLMTVPVLGDLISPVLVEVPVIGTTVDFKELAILLEDDEHPFNEVYTALQNNDQAYLKELLRKLKEDED